MISPAIRRELRDVLSIRTATNSQESPLCVSVASLPPNHQTFNAVGEDSTDDDEDDDDRIVVLDDNDNNEFESVLAFECWCGLCVVVVDRPDAAEDPPT